MKFCHCLLFWVFAFCAHAAVAQDFLFETLNSKNGLASNEVNCMYEDKNHFLWIGTRDGLSRFDGRVFKTFRNNPADTNSVSGNSVVSILQDAQGIFWIATKDGGLTRYDADAPSGKEFRQFKNNPKNKNSIATNRLNCLYDWDENYLMIGAEVFPAIFIHKKTFEFSYWGFNHEKLHPSICTPQPQGAMNWIHHIVAGDKQNIFFSMLLSGELFEADKKTGAMRIVHEGSNDVLSINQFFIDNNKVWMASWNPGLYLQQDVNYATTAQKNSGIDDLLISICNLNNNLLLAGSRSSGLYVVSKTTGALENYRKSIFNPRALPSNKINCLLVDSRGIIWVGTSSGIAKYDKHTWLFDEKEFAGNETDCNVLNCYRFVDGSAAVNTSKGMFLSDEFQMDFRNIRFNNRGKEVIPDFLLPMDDEEFLLGTENAFYRWKKNSTKLKEVNIQQPYFYEQGVYQVKEMIYDSVQGQHGAWMAVMGYGLAFYSFDDGSFYQYLNDNKNPRSLGSNLVRRLERDKNGNIWLATAAGLYMRSPGTPLNENSFIAFLNEPDNALSLPNNDVSDIWCTHDNVWITMNGGGLASFDGKKFTQYSPEDPLASRVFQGMHIDRKSRIWIITKNGLEVYDPKQKKFFHLDINDGAANANLSPHFSNEVKGIVHLTAGNILYSFEPDRMNFGLEFPNQYLTEMEVFGKSYLNDALHGVVELSSRDRYINFTVSALQFASSKTVRFQYRLQGLEENWTTSNDGQIKYTNLPWGNLKLLVRVTNPSGQFGPEKVLAQFNIATPVYYRWWFILLVIVVGALAAYAFYEYRIHQLEKLQAIRNKIARDLHDDIGSTLGSISVFSEAAKQLMDQDKSERAKVMLSKIGETSREMIENMSDIVWSVNPKNDTAKHLIERMRVFAGDLVASSEIQLHFNSAKDAEDLKLTMEQRKNIFLIFKETVYNTVKYSGGKNLYINLKKSNRNILLQIKDDGTGFDVNNYTSKNGNGLKNMRHRAQEVGAKFEIESSEKGTITSVTI